MKSTPVNRRTPYLNPGYGNRSRPPFRMRQVVEAAADLYLPGLMFSFPLNVKLPAVEVVYRFFG